MEVIVDTNILVYETVEDSIYHKDMMEKLEKVGMMKILFKGLRL